MKSFLRASLAGGPGCGGNAVQKSWLWLLREGQERRERADHPGVKLAASAGLLRNHRHGVRQPRQIFMLFLILSGGLPGASYFLRAPLGAMYCSVMLFAEYVQ